MIPYLIYIYKKNKQIPFEKYIEEYENDTEMYYITEDGNNSSSSYKFLTILVFILDSFGIDFIMKFFCQFIDFD